MVYRFENPIAVKSAKQAVEMNELRDALIELAQIIIEKEDQNG